MRIALAGLDSSRPVHAVRHLAGLCDAGHALVAVVTDALEPPVEVRRTLPAAAHLVDEPAELIGRVDAVLDFARAAGDRLARIGPLLDAGVHVLADKPLALTRADAVSLVDRARSHGVALHAASGFRLVPLLSTLHVTPATTIEVSGPADPRSPDGGLAFYGIHHAQVLDTVRPPAPDAPVRVERSGDGIAAWIGERTVLRFADGDRAASGFAIVVDGAGHGLVPPSDYLERLIDRFLAACAAPPRDDAWRRALVEPVALVERITEALARRR